MLWGCDLLRDTIREAVTWLDRYPGLRIGIENEAYTYDYLATNDPELLAEIRGYLQRYGGRFGIGSCTYGQPLSVFINEESNIRQIGYALRADREHLGCVPPVYLMSEHAMHAQMPQILAGFGFASSIMRTHFMMYGYNPTFGVAAGWWVGMDGSRIPTVPTYEGQGAEFGRTTLDNWILTRFPGPECDTPLEEFREKFAHLEPLLASRADDAKLRREELVRRYDGDPDYRWVLLEEIPELFPPSDADLRTAPNDFTVRMPWGYCGNEIWNGCREAEVAVLTAERMNALAARLGAPIREGRLREAWQALLVAQHHDIQICGLLEDARRFVPASVKSAAEVSEQSLGFVASRMGSDGPSQVTAFNPLSWRRREWAQTVVELRRGAARALEVRHADEIVPSAVLAADRYSDGSVKTARLGFLAELAPLAFASYAVRDLSGTPPRQPTGEIVVDAGAMTIATSFLEVSLNADGGVRRITDVRTGREQVMGASRSCFCAGRIDGTEHQSHGAWSIAGSRGPGCPVVARESGAIATIPYIAELTVHAHSPRLDWRVTCHLDGQRIGRDSGEPRDGVSGFVHEEKLRFKLFPSVSEAAVGVRDLPFAVAETPDRYVEGNYWTAIADSESGIAVFNRGTMGSVREEDGGFSIPLAYANHYIWGTRMLSGSYAYEFALYPFSGSWREADLHRRALEYGFPVVAVASEPGCGELGRQVRALDITGDGVVLSALYTQDGPTFARLYEYRGEATEASLALVGGEVRLVEVDLSGQEIGPVVNPLPFRPWQIRTFRVEVDR